MQRMNTSLRQFIGAYLGVVLGTLILVAFVAFVSMPYTLSRHPGEAPRGGSQEMRHMT